MENNEYQYVSIKSYSQSRSAVAARMQKDGHIGKEKSMALNSLAQIVRERFDDITDWRSSGVPWKQIQEFLPIHSGLESPARLKGAYYNELARRKSPKRLAALPWIEERYDAIKDLRGRGYDWPAVVGQLAGNAEEAPSMRTLVAEFRAIDAARSSVSPVDSSVAAAVPSAPIDPHSPIASQPATSPAPNPPCELSQETEIPMGVGRPRTMREMAQLSTTEISDNIEIADRGHRDRDAHLSNAPVLQIASPQSDAPPPRQSRSRALSKMLERQQEENKAQAAEKAEKGRLKAQELDYQPNADPYIKGEYLRSEIDRITQEEVIPLVRKLNKAAPDARPQIQTRINALNSERNHLNADFRTRHCHSKANRAVLATLSATALACGAFRIADESETIEVLGCNRSAIRLAGYDRPETIEGVPEIADPLFVIENFSDNDLSRIKEAYDADRAEVPAFDHSAATPRRRLAEAALVRGAYVWRIDGWCAYDDYISLEGDDHPSPSLVADSPLAATAVDYYLDAIERDYAPSIDLAPPLTGTEPDWDRLEPWKRDKLKASTGGWLDNDKGYGS